MSVQHTWIGSSSLVGVCHPCGLATDKIIARRVEFLDHEPMAPRASVKMRSFLANLSRPSAPAAHRAPMTVRGVLLLLLAAAANLEAKRTQHLLDPCYCTVGTNGLENLQAHIGETVCSTQQADYKLVRMPPRALPTPHTHHCPLYIVPTPHSPARVSRL